MILKQAIQELNWDEVKDKKHETNHLIESMLAEIGSVDPELRDHLIYSSFAKLILKDDLNPSQMAHIT